MNIQQPTNTEFNEAVQSLTKIIQEQDISLDIKKGSVIRELVIRPFAFCYTKVASFLNSWLSEVSFNNLSQSLQTSSNIVDTLSGNFFIERKSGSSASGFITLTLSIPSVRIPIHTRFIIDGYAFQTIKTYIITSDLTDYTDTSSCAYLKAAKITQNQYKVNIPVTSQIQGQIQIPRGVQVQVTSQIPYIQAVDILSPITGGTSAQSNASVIQRCKNSVINSIGTLDSIKAKLQKAASTVLSCNILDSKSPDCQRALLNPYGISIPGIVDLYIKTANQISTTQISLSVNSIESDDNIKALRNALLNEEDKQAFKYFIHIKDSDYCGLFSISSIIFESTNEDSPLQKSFISTFIYTDFTYEDLSDLEMFKKKQNSYRLSPNQETIIFLKQMPSSTGFAQVTFNYMPNIAVQNSLLNTQDSGFAGLDIMTKAALPVTIRIKAQLKSSNTISEQLLQQLKIQIAKIINAMPVGSNILNMDNVAQAIRSMYPTIRLVLPYTLSANLYRIDGSQTSIYSTTGVLDLFDRRNNSDVSNPSIYFFTTTPTYIDLQVL